MNHSCEPNCGFLGNVILVTMRDIEAGEELTFDYAMSDGCDYDEFECRCGRAVLPGQGHRQRLDGPGLQRRYRGWFSPYLARRIDRLAPIHASKRVFAAV